MSATPYKQLEQEWQRLHAFSGTLSLLRWDAAVMMPRGSADVRGEQIAAIQTEQHALLTSPRVSRLLDRAQAAEGALSDWERANLRGMRRQRDHAIATPASLISRLARATAIAEVRWAEAREKNQFHLFAPHLEEVLRLVRDKAALLGQALNLTPYDALVDEFTPGLRVAEIDALFGALSRRLPSLIRDTIARQADSQPLPLAGRYPATKQKQFITEIMKAMGFPFERGRLDESEHPFTEGVAGDLRITTRIDPGDPFTGLLAAMHEMGHALYDLGVPQEWSSQPVARERGMAMEESQALLVEMIICRSRAFVRYLRPLLQRHFAVSGPEWEVENLYRLLTRVWRSAVRVDADELTYPLHIMLRYDLEKRLLADQFAVGDLPDAWNQGMEARLELRPGTDTQGCLQDIHWAHGFFGYFPSYLVGAAIAAQLCERLRTACPISTSRSPWQFCRAQPVAEGACARPRRQAAAAGASEAGHRQGAGRRATAALPGIPVSRGRAVSTTPATVPAPVPQSGHFLHASQAWRASARPGRQGHRRLPDDPGRRPRDGLPVGRQGLLHAAGDAAVPAAQRSGELLADRREPGPEAAGLPGTCPAGLPARRGRGIPHHRTGHLQRRQTPHSRGPHDVQPVLAHAARRVVPLRGRERHHARSRLATIATISWRRCS